MTQEQRPLPAGDFPEFNQEAQAIWDQNAAFWDEKMGEGNPFHLTLIEPAVDRLLQPRPGETVLEVACGNGQYARHLATLGARVVAGDFSPTFIEKARQRSAGLEDQIDYRLLDATDREQLLALGRSRFDAAVCNMALMGMAAIEPLLQALGELLKPGGRFVFSIAHPCFNTNAASKILVEEYPNGEIRQRFAIQVHGYLGLTAEKGIGIAGQPAAHYYFHRPLSALFNACFAAGFVLDGLEEPAFAAGAPPSRSVSWANFPQIPPVLVARLRIHHGEDRRPWQTKGLPKQLAFGQLPETEDRRLGSPRAIPRSPARLAAARIRTVKPWAARTAGKK